MECSGQNAAGEITPSNGSHKSPFLLYRGMDDDRLADEPPYRAGVLTGRQHSFTDVMELFLDPNGGKADAKVLTVLNWCAQTQQEGNAEMALIVAELAADED